MSLLPHYNSNVGVVLEVETAMGENKHQIEPNMHVDTTHIHYITPTYNLHYIHYIKPT